MPSRRRLSGKPTITIQTNLQHNNNGLPKTFNSILNKPYTYRIVANKII